MLTVTMLIYIFVGMIFFLIAVLVFKKWADIMSFLYPDDWADVTMMEADNNVRSWLQKKNADLRFRFHAGWYNLFEAIPKEDLVQMKDSNGNPILDTEGKPIMQTNPDKLDKSKSVVYRAGRLGKFFYIEGNENPLDFRNATTPGNARLNYEQEAIDTTKLWILKKNGFAEFIEQYGIIILIIGVIVIVYILLSKGQTPPPTTGG